MQTPSPFTSPDPALVAELKRRRQLALAMLAALLVIVVAFAVHWVQRMQYREVSSDALVEGKLLQLTAPVAGTVQTPGGAMVGQVRPGQTLLEVDGLAGHVVVSSPVAGMVTQCLVQAGQQVAAGARLMVIAPFSEMWVTARFKQSQLRRLATGQAVTLTADSYGRNVRFHGTVIRRDGQAAAPAQRQPVRIALDANEVAAHPLQPGLRMRVSVDTRS